jgi:hypothetical protein
MRVAAIRQEANKLIREFGSLAYDKALEAARAARRRRNVRLEKYLAKVAQEIERNAGAF